MPTDWAKRVVRVYVVKGGNEISTDMVRKVWRGDKENDALLEAIMQVSESFLKEKASKKAYKKTVLKKRIKELKKIA